MYIFKLQADTNRDRLYVFLENSALIICVCSSGDPTKAETRQQMRKKSRFEMGVYFNFILDIYVENA
jgi:hypothetical protein